ncbi:BTB/POZ domain-containing protein [Colletotrichum kahawae]|uniref:BTB/POZ domain-containing protein n=1 Tax=Colletotrichum kahawae TaxID=34407 RepID=A0AAE0D5M7_COLKA|nr:BTB/POZ domain-containing protein [Colletotrichum kahawae]
MASLSRPQKDLHESLEAQASRFSANVATSNTYAVHHAIVCPRSEFFAAACRNAFREDAEGRISLPDNEPAIVDMMVQYFYRLDYRQPPEPEDDPSVTDQKQKSNQKAHSLLLHAKVYTLAEKYAIGGLKDLALSKFKTAAAQAWDTVDFLNAATEAYTSTVDSDRGMRDAAIEAFAKHKDLLGRNEVKTVIEGLGSFAFDLLMYFHRKGRI